MKKTLIALVSLAGVAFANDSIKWPTTAIDIDITSDLSQCTFESDLGLSLLPGTLLSTSTTDNVGTNGSYNINDLRPSVNIGNGGTWTLTLNLQNTGTEVLSLAGVELDVFTFNSNGYSQPASTPRYFDFTISAGENELYTSIDSKLDESPFCIEGSGNNNDANAKSDTTFIIAFTETYELGIGESVALSLKVSDGNNSANTGSFIGLSSMGVLVPEPATATLSLLALAGLAARRRRK